MRLHLNGELREAPDLATLADLARLKEGDRLEVVRLVGGG